MTRSLSILNLALLALLGGLCVYQWRNEYRDSLQITQLQRETSEQRVKLDEQARTARRQGDDASSFKEQIARLQVIAESSEALSRTNRWLASQLEKDRVQFADQAAQWMKAVEAYKSAVLSRDESIKTLREQRETLLQRERDAASRANEAVLAYNQLAEKYKAAVNRYTNSAGDGRKK
jgi:hypothetical protein